MNEQRIEALRRVYEQWGRGNWGAGAELLSPTVHAVWQVAPGEAVSHGTDELQRNLREFMSQWTDWRVVAEHYISVSENTVLVTARQYARGKQSGALVDSPIYTAWVFDGDQVIGLYWHFDRDEALLAARP